MASKDFSSKTLRNLAAKGIKIVSSMVVPDSTGSYADGDMAYMLSTGELRTFAEVLALSK
jgi:hypothetical protein